MRTTTPILACSAVALLVLGGCHDASDNNCITVKNRTDDAIVVEYAVEVERLLECDGDGDGHRDRVVIREERESWVPAHDERDLLVGDEWWWSWMRVCSHGLWRDYQVEVDAVGNGTLWVRPEDFAPASAPVGRG
jgi:hypothetical protein